MADRFLTFDKPPYRDQFVDRALRMSRTWVDWWNRLMLTLNAVSVRMNAVSLSDQDSSISATDFSNYTLAAGIYRASYYARITTAAATSSSLTVAISWTDGGVVQTYTGSAITGNTTTTNQTASLLMRVDASTAVNYSTTYASVGAPPGMAYSLDVVLEKIKGT